MTFVDGCAGASSTSECKGVACPKHTTALGANACVLPGAFTVLGSRLVPVSSGDCKGSAAFIPFNSTPTAGLCAHPFTKADMEDDIIFTQAPTAG